jgi:hypothetical protein
MGGITEILPEGEQSILDIERQIEKIHCEKTAGKSRARGEESNFF